MEQFQISSLVPHSQVPQPTLRCGSGEGTPQELGILLWSHITQKISMVVTKTWCFLENCIRGQATDVGVTHFPSLVARQEAVLGRRAFATWVAARLPLVLETNTSDENEQIL